jgi:hypothetical protein
MLGCVARWNLLICVGERYVWSPHSWLGLRVSLLSDVLCCMLVLFVSCDYVPHG